MAALAAYRNVLRATRVAFSGDHRVLVAARTQARSSFDNDRVMDRGGPEAEARILHAQEVATFLRANVVQGEKTGSSDEQYKIRIHNETERGDNETIKSSAGKPKTRGQTNLQGTTLSNFKKCS